ncbi:MAG: hypothetical protein ACETWG_01230 [Candidatus Neomarinimicrobiota bacterium]
MISFAGVVLLAGVLTLSAQDQSAPLPPGQEEAPRVPDSLRQSLPSQLPADQSVAPFYHPPVIREVWNRFYQLVDTLDDRALTRRFIQALLDSLARTVQADFDSLAVRARAFETREKGYTHRFYRSPLTRDEILGEPISEREASDIPHFHAVYDPQGYLLRVRYVEPRKWRARQQLLAEGSFQSRPGSPPMVRYFQAWDVRRLRPVDYTRKKKIPENEPYIRVIYDDRDIIKSLQNYNEAGELLYTVTYGRVAVDSSSYARLEFAGDSSASLLTVHPYIFLRDWSVVRPGWKVALTSDENGYLASTQVFNQLDQISYYYTFSLRTEPDTNTRSLRATVLSDTGKIEQVYALVYDQDDRMVRRSFYTPEGELLETTTYDYHPRSSELVVTTRNAAGIITSRQRFIDPSFGN